MSQKEKITRATGLGRIRREQDLSKWTKVTSLRFRHGGDIRYPWPAFSGWNWKG